MRKTLLPCLAIVLLSSITAPAALLLDYTFTGNTLNPATVGSNLSGSAIGNGGGLTVFPTYNTNYSGPSGTPSLASSGWDQADFSGADLTGDYYTFTLTVASGYQVSLTEFDIYLNRNGTGPETYDIRYSLNAFASTLATGSAPNDVAMTNVVVSLNDVAITTPIEFRIYGYGGTGGAFRVDDISVQGTITAVPEPSAIALSVAGLFAIGAFRRWRNRRKMC